MRPIDADALIEKFGGWYVDECTESGFIGTLKDILATEPTIQPQSTAGQLNDSAQSTNLIDRQAAIDGKISIQRANGVEIYSDEAVPVEYLKSLPPAQPEPHEGHWIEGGIYRGLIECNCSECGQLMTTAATVRMNYCPNCGAKMTISTK